MRIITLSREFGSGGRELGKRLADYLNFAKGDCIVVGRGADTTLESYNPFNLFVHADMAAKIKRCGNYADEKENLTEKEIQAKIRHIDQQRRQYYELCTGKQWGEKENYHLCINTTEMVIKEFVPSVAEYAKIWLERGRI